VVVTLAVAAACGSRTGLLVPEEEEDASIDAHVDHHVVDAADVVDVVFPDVPIVSDCPDAGETLVYVLGAGNELYSFYPPTRAFKYIGTIACPSTSSAFSMAVSRSGIAFTCFFDGTLYEVSTANAACKGTTYVQATQFGQFGMGYAGIADGGESLFVADHHDHLDTIDTATFVGTTLGVINPPQAECELTGTNDGHLYGFCPIQGSSSLVEIDPKTAAIVSSHKLSIGLNSNSYDYAFAFWGGEFWFFLSTGGVLSTVTEYDPATQTETDVATAPITIVGAGVSTCAPLTF
ncbi:MAG TPA: hypothetical protein VH054_23620, partial [Polyangiaceae bacterium]|nr:hypothetical protein [Polyangiaceae bacterium]